MIEDYDSKKTQTKGKLVFSEFKKVVNFFTDSIISKNSIN
jgi:hypothetical protein